MELDSCPVDGTTLRSPQASNALSRVMTGVYICTDCGNREAMLDMRASRVTDRRVCLYEDEVSGIMLVVEDEPGYEPFGRKPVSQQFARDYCAAWNRAIGIDDGDVGEILASSMFGRWANFT